MYELKPTNSVFSRAGRWSRTDSDSLVAFWSGATLSFLFHGDLLKIRCGPLTERKDPLNGRIPMISCSISATDTKLQIERQIRTFDGHASCELVLYENDKDNSSCSHQKLVELTMVDWASVFELESVVMNSEQDISPVDISPVRVLVIGDSISCGYSDGSERIPHGCLDAYPFKTRQRLAQTIPQSQITVDLVAFPGISLVSSANPGDLASMEEKISHASPWSREIYEEKEGPNVIIIALGTNDEARDVPVEVFEDAMVGFVQKLETTYHDSVEFVCLLHPFPDFNEEEPTPLLSGSFPRITHRLRQNSDGKVSYEVWGICENLKPHHTMDGLHPTTIGHDILADTLVEFLQALLLRTDKPA